MEGEVCRQSAAIRSEWVWEERAALTAYVPKTKIVKQEPQQQTTPTDAEPTDFTPIRPQPPLPNQQDDRDKR